MIVEIDEKILAIKPILHSIISLGTHIILPYIMNFVLTTVLSLDFDHAVN